MKLDEYPADITTDVTEAAPAERDDDYKTIVSVHKRLAQFRKDNYPVSEEDLDRFSHSVTQEFRELVNMYPIVFKYMIYLDMFDKTALKRYMKVSAKKTAKSVDEQAAIMADYVVILSKCMRSGMTERQISQLRQVTTKSIKDDLTGFNSKLKELINSQKTDAQDAELSVKTALKDAVSKGIMHEEAKYEPPKMGSCAP